MNNFVRLQACTYLLAIFVSILPRVSYSKTMNYYQLSKADSSICLKFKAQCDCGRVKSTAYKRKIDIDKCNFISGNEIRYRDPFAYIYRGSGYTPPTHKTAQDEQELKSYVCKKKSKSRSSNFNFVEFFFEILIEGLTGGFSGD